MVGEATWLSLLSLLPPLSLFLAISTLDMKERRQLTLTLLAFAVLSGFMALLQAAQGEESLFRFYNKEMHDSAPVGFFANRNHLGALLYCGGMLAMAWILASYDALRLDDGDAGHRNMIALAASAFALVTLASVELVLRSRAAVFLFFLGALVLPIVVTLRRSLRRGEKDPFETAPRNWLPIGAAVVTLVAIPLIFVGSSSLQGVFDRFAADQLTDERPVMVRVTLLAAGAMMPFGSGLGSFVPTFQMFEKPRDLFAGTFANHAHNDLLELALETGLGGLLLLCAFIVWLALRARRAWATPQRPGIDAYLQDAAIVVIMLFLGHSLVDYPLRTSALLSVFAIACALLIKPPGNPESHQSEDKRDGRRRQRHRVRHGASEVASDVHP